MAEVVQETQEQRLTRVKKHYGGIGTVAGIVIGVSVARGIFSGNVVAYFLFALALGLVGNYVAKILVEKKYGEPKAKGSKSEA